MNNDYNDFNKENETPAEKVGETEPTVPETESTVPEDNTPAEEQTLDAADTPAKDADNAGAADAASDKSDGEDGIGYTYDDGGDVGQHEAKKETQSGSYTYRGQYGAGYTPASDRRDTAPAFTPDVKPAKTPKPKKSGVSAAALAVTVVVSILLSAAAGFGGAYLYNDMYAPAEDVSNVGGADDGAVLHRVVESELSTSTGVKGIYTDVAETVKASVVEITTEFQVTGFFQYVSEGAGSGVIISKDGYIITNNHVISDSDSGNAADTITVRLTNGTEYEAKLVGKDADSDIAVIKIEPEEELSFAVFGDSDKLTVGEEVIAVGNPLGELGGTVTNGIISALDREINVDGTNMNLLQTNAAINPGNSGGGLFNMKGELVGVVNAKSSGSGIEGLGFAIPANDAFDVAEQLMTNGYVTGKVYLGISFYDVTDPYTAYRYFKSQATGVYVVELEEGFNDKVLKQGDRVVAIDGDEITEFSQIKDLLKEHEVGDTLKFTVHRSGKLTEVDVTCFEYVPEEAAVDFGEKS